jgi:hypothetical protein
MDTAGRTRLLGRLTGTPFSCGRLREAEGEEAGGIKAEGGKAKGA